MPWFAIVISLVSPQCPSPPPGFVYGIVYGIVVSLFVLFNGFAIVQWKQYRAKGKWADYLHRDRRYIVLSLIAKTALGWQVFAGTLAR